MANFTFFDEWVRYGEAVVDAANDVFKMGLTNTTPDTANHTVKGDLTELSATNGYASKTLTTTWLETAAGSGIWRLAANADQVWTASGGSVGPFRYAFIWDDTVATPTKPLVGYWDYGSNLTLANGESFTVDLDANFAIYTKTKV